MTARSSTVHADDVTGCPKRMVFGPCGGVRDDLRCEVDARPCPFVHAPAPSPVLPTRRTPQPLRLAAPLVVVDVRAPTMWAGDIGRLWHAAGRELRGCVALLGEHVDNPPTRDDSGAIDPVAVVEVLGEEGVPAIVTVTGRDRDLAGARHDIDRYVAAGAAAIHCVTGDHPAAMGLVRPATFGAESMTIIGEAVDAGVAAGVGESPASPGDRVTRLRQKEAAGASLCILNHHGSVDDMVAFADACRAGGVRMPLVAPIPMIGDARSANALARFPGLRLAPGLLQQVATARDPAAEGRAVALAMAAELARSGRFAGVNLSGATGATEPWARLRIAGDLARRIRETWVS